MSNAKLLNRHMKQQSITETTLPVLPYRSNFLEVLNVEGHDDDKDNNNDNDHDNDESAMRAEPSFVYRVTAGTGLYELA